MLNYNNLRIRSIIKESMKLNYKLSARHIFGFIKSKIKQNWGSPLVWILDKIMTAMIRTKIKDIQPIDKNIG